MQLAKIGNLYHVDVLGRAIRPVLWGGVIVKFLLTLAMVIAIFLLVTDDQELSVSSKHFYFKAEFPRSIEPPWYVIEWGSEPGLGSLIEGWRPER